MFLLAIGGAKTVLSICRAETLNCGSNFTNCQDYDGVIRILKMSLLNTIKSGLFLFSNKPLQDMAPTPSVQNECPLNASSL